MGLANADSTIVGMVAELGGGTELKAQALPAARRWAFRTGRAALGRQPFPLGLRAC